MGSLYQSLGEFKQAAEQYKNASVFASDEQIARMLLSASEMHLALNHPGPALRALEKAAKLLGSTSDPMLEGAILAAIGRSHMIAGNFQEARYDFERAKAKVKESGNTAGEAGIMASIAELNYWMAISSPTLNSGRFKDALHDYNQALALMRTVGDRSGEIGVLTNIGLVFDAWGKSREAVTSYLQALHKMEELQTAARLEEFRIDLASQSAALYQRTVQLEVDLHRDQDAFELSERARARIFLDQLGNKRLDLKNQPPPDFSKREAELRQDNISLERQLGQEMSKPSLEWNADRIRVLQSKLAKVRTEYVQSVQQLRVANPEYASVLSISPLTLKDVQAQLAADVTVVSYFTTLGETLAFILTNNSFHVTKLPVTEQELSLGVATFLDFSGQNDVPSLKRLYKSLIAPLKGHLKTPILAVVPYGVLHDLPFAALTSDGQHYLGDSYALFTLPSASVLPYIRARSKPTGYTVLVMANNEDDGLPRLSHAYDEARSVASFFDSVPFLGDAATASTFQAHAGDYDILHLIAHIEPDENNPGFSRIGLGRGKDNEGPLELDQVLGLDLRKTSLVVLSGCQSQKGRRTRGDDVIGLSRAFIYAGSPSVLASLWSVDDDATKQLMAAFYTHLKEGLSKAEALRAAQVDTRNKYPNPYYWAGFVLTGDPGSSTGTNLLAKSAK
jgi:tetratricopeptide (TPR) repeat protein